VRIVPWGRKPTVLVGTGRYRPVLAQNVCAAGVASVGCSAGGRYQPVLLPPTPQGSGTSWYCSLKDGARHGLADDDHIRL
jgi:hypothetical protein